MKTERTKKTVKDKQIITSGSITCGKDNPASLGCEYYELEGGEVATFFVPTKLHEGHRGIMHGGMSASVLDEVMGRSISNCEALKKEERIPKYVTAEMTTKYLRPVLVGQKIYGYGRVYEVDGSRCYASSELVDEEGNVMALGKGIYVRVDFVDDRLPGQQDGERGREPLSEDDPRKL